MRAIFLRQGHIPIIIHICIIALATTLAPFSSHAETIILKAPSFIDGTHEYYHDLLRQSLEAAGQELILEPSPKHLPQKRAVSMLEDDMLSLLWLVQTRARDEKFTPVKVGITNNLIGHRILFIPKGGQENYDRINTLGDFRKTGLVGGFGKNWFDVKVWRENNLKYIEKDGEWRNLYRMVGANRGIDYFSRGFNEIASEARLHPNLDIEKRLMLIYDRDFRFYLSPSAAKYKEILEDSLKKAKSSGLMDKLIRKHWADAFSELTFDGRVKIRLKAPGNTRMATFDGVFSKTVSGVVYNVLQIYWKQIFIGS